MVRDLSFVHYRPLIGRSHVDPPSWTSEISWPDGRSEQGKISAILGGGDWRDEVVVKHESPHPPTQSDRSVRETRITTSVCCTRKSGVTHVFTRGTKSETRYPCTPAAESASSVDQPNVHDGTSDQSPGEASWGTQQHGGGIRRHILKGYLRAS